MVTSRIIRAIVNATAWWPPSTEPKASRARRVPHAVVDAALGHAGGDGCNRDLGVRAP